MKLDLEVQGPNLVAHVSGDLDVMTAEAFRRQVDLALSRYRPRHLYVDMAGVTFVDSSGLGAILGRYKRVRQMGGRMVLKNPPAAIQPVLELAGLFRLMEVVQEMDPARSGGGSTARRQEE